MCRVQRTAWGSFVSLTPPPNMFVVIRPYWRCWVYGRKAAKRPVLKLIRPSAVGKNHALRAHSKHTQQGRHQAHESDEYRQTGCTGAFDGCNTKFLNLRVHDQGGWYWMGARTIEPEAVGVTRTAVYTCSSSRSHLLVYHGT